MLCVPWCDQHTGLGALGLGGGLRVPCWGAPFLSDTQAFCILGLVSRWHLNSHHLQPQKPYSCLMLAEVLHAACVLSPFLRALWSAQVPWSSYLQALSSSKKIQTFQSTLLFSHLTTYRDLSVSRHPSEAPSRALRPSRMVVWSRSGSQHSPHLASGSCVWNRLCPHRCASSW